MGVALILAAAVVFDLVLGEPHNVIHPVAWMGKVVSFLERGGYRLHRALQFFYGLLLTLFAMALCIVPVYYLLSYLSNLSVIAGIVVGALFLKLTFSIQGLRRAARRIKKLLDENDLPQARLALRALVGRDTADLSKPLLVSAAVESVAENTSDSLVAPLFYFMIFGLPGAIGYRVVNTMDAMIGYHGKYEYLGKFAARFDDFLNFIPARLTAFLLIFAAFILRKNGRRAWQTAFRDHGKTESPNAGWPMAAMAGALNARLEKVGHYKLGENNTALVPAAIDTSVKLLLAASLSWVLVCLVLGLTEVF